MAGDLIEMRSGGLEMSGVRVFERRIGCSIVIGINVHVGSRKCLSDFGVHVVLM